MSCKLQNIFLWFSKVSWIARRSKISFLKVGKAWNVLQASENFSMIFKSVQDCQKVQKYLSEFWQVLECLGSFKIFFYDFQKPPGLPEGQKYLYWSLTSPGMSCKLQNIFLWFLKESWIARSSKITLLKFEKPWNVLQVSKFFLWFLKESWITSRSKITLLKFDQHWNVLQASKYFSKIFKRVLDCQ